MRIGSLNVHSWVDSSGKDSRSRLKALLEPLDLDVIALQEAKLKRRFEGTKELAEGLGFPFVKHNGGEMALLSRFNITSFHLLGRGGFRKRFFGVRVSLPRSPLQIINLHLDFQTEVAREHEMQRVFSAIDTKHPTLMIGDFNALNRDDYSIDEWDEIARVRQMNLWEPPVSRLMYDLKAKGWGDSRCLAPPNKVTGLNSTSRFGTRVDYVMVDANVQKIFQVTSSLHISTEASDHSLVVTEFREKPDPEQLPEA